MTRPPPAPLAENALPDQRRAAWRMWLARGIAVAADVVQILMLPAGSAMGGFNPISDAIDVGTALLLTLLVGWHLAFVPSFVIKFLPFADLAPTWTVAIAIATWPKKRAPAERN